MTENNEVKEPELVPAVLEPEKKKSNAGRKPKPITEAQLRGLMRMKPTKEDVAAFFECTTRTIDNHIKKHYKTDFFTFRDQNAVHTRHALIRKAIEKALDGDNQMLIFTLKNMCHWKEKAEIEHSPTESLIRLAYSL